jgi:hypothetical protein
VATNSCMNMNVRNACQIGLLIDGAVPAMFKEMSVETSRGAVETLI